MQYSIKDVYKKKGYSRYKPYPCINRNCEDYQKPRINEIIIYKKENQYIAKITCPKCKEYYILKDDKPFYHRQFPKLNKYIEIEDITKYNPGNKREYKEVILPKYEHINGYHFIQDSNKICKAIRKYNHIQKIKKIIKDNIALIRTGEEIDMKIIFALMLYFGKDYRKTIKEYYPLHEKDEEAIMMALPVISVTQKWTILLQKIKRE